MGNNNNMSDKDGKFAARPADALSNNLSGPTSPRSVVFNKYAKEAVPLDFEVPMLGPEHVNEISKCNGYNYGEAKMHFNHLATNYEAIYLRLGYPDPMMV